MRAIHVVLFGLIFIAFTGMFAAADQVRTPADLAVPASIGLCFAVSLTLLLSDEQRRRKKRKSCSPPGDIQ